MARGPTRERLELAANVARFRRDGMTYKEISGELGISHSYVGDLLKDPDGALGRKRKAGYGGVCEVCGGPTSGSLGRAKAARLCYKCSPKEAARARHYWTRERVIEAIQIWAEEKGRPPRANDWRKNSPDGRFPNHHYVYKSPSKPGGLAPFDSWADAIEAAGFPRPMVGVREGEQHWSRGRVIDELRAKASNGIAPPSTADTGLYRAAVYYYGGWLEALAVAGLQEQGPYYGATSQWTPERVIEEIQAAAIGDFPPSMSEYSRGKLLQSAYGFFGSWTNAVRAAGFEPFGPGPSRRARRRKELFDKFKRAA